MYQYPIAYPADYPHIQEGSSAVSTLQDFASSIIMDISANRAESYVSGQTLANMVETPSGGDAQTDYDFWFGADGTADSKDPTYSGSGTTGKFTFDGTNMFLSNKIFKPAILDDIYGYKTDSTFIFYFKTSSDVNTWQALLNSSASTGNIGMWLILTNKKLYFMLNGIDGATSRARRQDFTNAVIQANTEYLVMVTTSAGTTANTKDFSLYINDMVTANQTFTEIALTNTALSAQVGSGLHIGAERYGSTWNFKAGTEFYGCAIANTALTQQERTDIKTELLARRGL